MPIGTLTMILANVGLSLFNNWQGSKQNAELQRKKEEFDRAVMENQRERMWKLMREGQELTLQMEKERHQQRLDDLKSDFDNLVKRLAYDATISHWPLKVLPMVMKNQALGNLLAKQEEGVALHCILTPSNNLPFNRAVLPVVERELESFCNQHWSTMTTHPILFYSGAWNGVSDPTGTQIESLKSALGNLPTLLIAPYFRPNDGKLTFQINIWGVGASATDKYENVQVIEPTDYQRDYTFDCKYEEDAELVDNATEDIVPYLQCLIGYFADTYFWSAFGHAPQLPVLIVNGTINTDGMPYLINDSREYYDELLITSEKKSLEQPFAEDNLLNLYDGASVLWDENMQKAKLEDCFVEYCNRKFGNNFLDIQDAFEADLFTINDLAFVETFFHIYKFERYKCVITNLFNDLNRINFDYAILNSTDIQELERLALEEKNAVAMYRLGEIYEYSIGTKYNKILSDKYYEMSFQNRFILAVCWQNPTKYTLFKRSFRYLRQANVIQAWVLVAKYCLKEFNSFPVSIIPKEVITSHPFLMHQLAKANVEAKVNVAYAEQLLLCAADSGYIESQELLCNLYKEGNVLKENPQSHFKYAEKMMMQRSPLGTYLVALCYLKGYGTKKSSKVVLVLLEKAIEYGSKDALRIKSIINQI